MQKSSKKHFIIISITLAIFVCLIFWGIYELYVSEKFFFKYNQEGDVWICDNLQLTVTYRSGTIKGHFWFTKEVENETVIAKFDGIEKEFLVDLGPGHAKQFNLFDRDNEVYALYGKYKMKNSDTLIASFEETYTDEINEYWNKNYPEFSDQISSLIALDEELVFHKIT